MRVKLEFEGAIMNLACVYVSRVDCEMKETEKFWSKLDEVVDSIPEVGRLESGE